MAAVLIALVAGLAGAARAHEVRPGYLELRETDPGTWEVLWKVPARGDRRLALEAKLPAGCAASAPTVRERTPGAFVDRWTVACGAGLVDGTIAVDGLEATLTDVLVRIEPREGPVATARLRPDETSFVVPAVPSRSRIAGTYLRLGFEHILGGFDHLLFVLALLLVVESWRMLVATVSAFTLAHSVTLAAASLGWVHVPSAPVEAAIALSIVFVAAEIVHARQGRPGLTARAPWIVALAFGLLHGFGFAGALAEVGLPDGEIPLALLLFNVGVELGQLVFVAAMLAGMAVLRGVPVHWPAWAWRVPAYGIGSLAAFWTLERVAAF